MDQVTEPIAKGENQGQFNILDYCLLLWHRKWIIVLCSILAMSIGAVHGLSQIPLYVAEATVQVQKSDGDRGGVIENSLEGLGSFGMDTQIELIKSRSLAEKVVKALNLQFERDVERMFWQDPSLWRRIWTRVMLNIGKGEIQLPYTIEPLEIIETYQPGVYSIQFLSATRFIVTEVGGVLLAEGQVEVPVHFRGLTMVVNGIGQPGQKETVRLVTLRDAAEKVQGRIRAEPVRATDILRIQAESPNHDQAREIANAVTQEYISLILARKVKAAMQSMDFIRDQFQPVLLNLTTAEKRLSEFKKNNASTALSENSQNVLAGLAEVEREIKRLEVLRQEVGLVLKQLKNRTTAVEDLNEVLLLGKDTGGMAGAILDQLKELLLRRAVLKAQVTDQHPSMRQLNAQIERLSEQLPDALESVLDSLQKKENLLRETNTMQMEQFNHLPLAEQQLARHVMEVKVNQNLYNLLFEKQEELRLASASQVSNVWVVDKALTPRSAVTKRVSRYFMMGGVVGLLLGILLVVGWDRYVDSSIKKEEEFAVQFRVPTIGTVPLLRSVTNGHSAAMVSLDQPQSYSAEAYRYLWTNLQFATFELLRKSLLITSSVKEEGKTTVAVNLAVTIAQMGKRVLLVDADFRRPQIHVFFSLPQSPGFSDYLSGEPVMPHEPGIQNLAVMTSGALDSQPLALMAPSAVEGFLATMSEQYDFILFDSPPLLPAADTSHLGNFVEGIILVVKLGYTPAALVRRGIEKLRNVRSKFLGVVLNSVSSSGENGYMARYYNDGRPFELKSLMPKLKKYVRT